MEKKFEIINDRDDRKVSQEQFEEKSTNIYEAVMVLGHRMRQIERKNSKEFEKLRNSILDERTEKEYNKEYVAEIIDRDLPVFPKAIRVSMNEMLNDELEYDYEDITKLED
ncbi:MAG TPA: DNA-directed RNA polymerase subunit omega [Clostridiales bacterium]|jgi:DNA-directed RNA polymerase subunit K/omega|nr:DNA-directed RNA polymerase subunit omega [Clostridiales bacterium]HQP69629.1 DNA-directed RNA polymerase subunit omega [Clostridiales bacterium]